MIKNYLNKYGQYMRLIWLNIENKLVNVTTYFNQNFLAT